MNLHKTGTLHEAETKAVWDSGLFDLVSQVRLKLAAGYDPTFMWRATYQALIAEADQTFVSAALSTAVLKLAIDESPVDSTLDEIELGERVVEHLNKENPPDQEKALSDD